MAEEFLRARRVEPSAACWEQILRSVGATGQRGPVTVQLSPVLLLATPRAFPGPLRVSLHEVVIVAGTFELAADEFRVLPWSPSADHRRRMVCATGALWSILGRPTNHVPPPDLLPTELAAYTTFRNDRMTEFEAADAVRLLRT